MKENRAIEEIISNSISNENGKLENNRVLNQIHFCELLSKLGFCVIVFLLFGSAEDVEAKEWKDLDFVVILLLQKLFLKFVFLSQINFSRYIFTKLIAGAEHEHRRRMRGWGGESRQQWQEENKVVELG